MGSGFLLCPLSTKSLPYLMDVSNWSYGVNLVGNPNQRGCKVCSVQPSQLSSGKGANEGTKGGAKGGGAGIQRGVY